MKTRIISHGVHLPPQKVDSNHMFEDIKLEQRYGIPNTWMTETMGIKERRIADPGVKPSELAIAAARNMFDNFPDIKPADTDLIIFCGIERDQAEPATAHTVQHRLGLHAEHAFDVSNACFGFIDGVKIASNFVQTGMVRQALVVTGECNGQLIDHCIKTLKSDVDDKTARNTLGFLSVGDAGGAVIVAPGEDAGSGIEVFNCLVDSAHVDKCYYRHKADGSIEGQMLMAPIVAAGFRMQKSILKDTMQKLGWNEFDWFLSHQTGRRNFEQIADLKIIDRERMVRTYPLLGNITSATFPVSLAKLYNKQNLKPGDRIGGCFGGSGLVVGQFGMTV